MSLIDTCLEPFVLLVEGLPGGLIFSFLMYHQCPLVVDDLLGHLPHALE